MRGSPPRPARREPWSWADCFSDVWRIVVLVPWIAIVSVALAVLLRMPACRG